MNSLDLDTINELLKESSTKSSSTKSFTPHERPIQLGPLRYFNETFRCVKKRCTSPTCIKVNGVPYCVTHALYALNQLTMKTLELDWVDKECDCDTGKSSMGCMHNEFCSTFGRLKEQRGNGTI